MDKKSDYHHELYKIYIKELNWDISNTNSGLYIEKECLFDKHDKSSKIKELRLKDKFVLGFRILEKCLDLQNYCHDLPEEILNNSIEVQRFVIHPNFRKLGLYHLLGKIAFDYCQEHNIRYAVMVPSNKKLRKRLRKFIGLKIIKNGCRYSDDTLDIFIYDTHSFPIKFFYKILFYPYAGSIIISKLIKNIITK